MRRGLSHAELATRSKRAVSSHFFTLQLLPITSLETRFSCVISKKIAPRAVSRNRAKRRMRAAFQAVAQSPGLFVIHIKKPALSAKFSDLVEELSASLSKIKGS